MKKSILLTSALLVTGVLCAAEADSNVSLKLRGQTGFETTDGVRNGFGAGINYAIKLGSTSSVNIEAGYQYFAGKQYRQSVVANSAGIVTDGANTNSVDSRKNSLEGLSFRGSFVSKFADNFSWQIGVALGSLKSHHESIVSFSDAKGNLLGNWDLALDKTNLSFSPYAGIRYDMDEIGALEFNVILSSYKEATVEPSIGTTVTPIIGDKTVTKPKFEIGYVFKF